MGVSAPEPDRNNVSSSEGKTVWWSILADLMCQADYGVDISRGLIRFLPRNGDGVLQANVLESLPVQASWN